MLVMQNEYVRAKVLEELKFAAENGTFGNLVEQLAYLNGYANERHHTGTDYETKCYLSGDMYPHTLGFNVCRKAAPDVEIPERDRGVEAGQVRIISGGLVFHEDSQKWSCHT